MLVVLGVALAVVWATALRDPATATARAEPVAVQAQKTVTKPRTPAAAVAVKARPSDKARLKLRSVISGNISPKSVASSGAGYVTAQNMMYRHSVTVYDARSLKLVKTISDAVNLRRLGFPSYPGTSRAGRGGVLPRRPLRVRLELFDVRRELRA